MKKIIFVLTLVFVSLVSLSQTYTDVVKTKDTTVSKEMLFIKANEWVVENFKSSNDVIQLSDKASGMIYGKGCFKYINNSYMCMNHGQSFSGYEFFTFKLWIKEGKYKYEFSKFYFDTNIPFGCSKQKVQSELDVLIKERVSNMTNSLYQKMNKSEAEW